MENNAQNLIQNLAEFAFKHAPVGLVVTRYRLIQECSPSFASMFGYEPAELRGRSLAMLYPSTKEFVDIGKDGLKEMSASMRYANNRIMKRRDGTHFWCQVVGQSTTPKDPFALCVWSFMDLSTDRPVVRLTDREREIAMLAVDGLTNKEIGSRLGVSHRTVEVHRSRIMQKLHVNNSAEMFAVLTGSLP